MKNPSKNSSENPTIQSFDSREENVMLVIVSKLDQNHRSVMHPTQIKQSFNTDHPSDVNNAL